MLRDVWIDEKPKGPSSQGYMLLVRPSPEQKWQRPRTSKPSFHPRHPINPKPIPPSPLRLCAQCPFVPQTGNFHTPSAHHHQNSRSTCSPPPQIHPSAFRPRCGAQIDHQKNWTLGVARDKAWAHHWTLALVVSRVLHRTRAHGGNARLAGAQGRFGHFGGASLGVVRQKGLAKACFFFEGRDEEGGGEEGGLVRGDGVHARCRGRWMALGAIWMEWGDVCICLVVVDGGC